MRESYVVVAMEDELQLEMSRIFLNLGAKPIVTGVGGTNVIRALKDLPKDALIHNIGYAGMPIIRSERCGR